MRVFLFSLALSVSSRIVQGDTKWFERHLVNDASKRAAYASNVKWPRISELEELVLNLTTTQPDPRLDYIIVRAWPDAPGANLDFWPKEYEDEEVRELAQWLEPENRSISALRIFLDSLNEQGGALVVRELERLPIIRNAVYRAMKKTRRTLWHRDRIHIFRTVQAYTGSYGWHYDLSDNILFSLGGQKHFRVAGRKPHSELLLDVNLTKNDLIYIPRKLFHNGIGLQGGSILVSIALKPHHPLDFWPLRWRRLRTRLKSMVIRTFASLFSSSTFFFVETAAAESSGSASTVGGSAHPTEL